jgi:hypothetical protein
VSYSKRYMGVCCGHRPQSKSPENSVISLIGKHWKSLACFGAKTSIAC